MKVKEITISELSRLTECTKPLISRYYKEHPESKVSKSNNRIVGISSDAINDYFIKSGFSYYYKPSVILSANLCGGVGKTTSSINIAAALRRVNKLSTPIIIVDADPQGSTTKAVFGECASDDDLILYDFIEGRVSIDELVVDCGNNIWFVKSNLNQYRLDKLIDKPKEIKDRMLHFYQALFEKFGTDIRVVQDNAPALNAIFASSICALHQLPDDYHKSLIIPMRSDDSAITGADLIINEVEDIKQTFNFQSDIDIHCFFSSIDRRASTTATALKMARDNELIIRHMSPIGVRYCGEVPRSFMEKTNVFNLKRSNNAAEDYQDLLHYICSFRAKEGR